MPPRKPSKKKIVHNMPTLTAKWGTLSVYCAFDELVQVEKVIANPKNPNKHPDKQISLLARVIRAQGWRSPITMSTRTGFVVRGHGRLLAAKKLGLDMVPVDRQDYENEAAEYADLVADNRIAELASIDVDELKEIMLVLPPELQKLTGYDEDLVKSILSEDTEGGADTSPQLDEMTYQVVVTCNDQEDQAVFLAEMDTAGREAKPLIT